MLLLEVGGIVVATMVVTFIAMLVWHVYREAKPTSQSAQEVIPDDMAVAFGEWEREKGAK